MSTGIAVASLIISAAGGAVSYHQQQQAQQQQKNADKAQQRLAEVENQRAIRQSIAQARMQQAELIASGQAQTGGTTDSAIQGGLAASQTQEASNIGFAQSSMAANNAINDSIGRYNKAVSYANTASTIGALPSAFGWDPKSAAKVLKLGPQ